MVAPLVPPVIVSPTVNDPEGMGTSIVVDEGLLVIVVDSPLVLPVIVSPTEKLALDVTVNVKVLAVRLVGLKK